MTLPPCHPSSRLAVAPVQLPQPPGALFRCTPWRVSLSSPYLRVRLNDQSVPARRAMTEPIEG